MRGADATARIAVEVLVEGNVVPVVGIGLLLGAVMPERALARGVLQEDVREAAAELVRDLLDLFGGSPKLLVSNLLESGDLTLRDLNALQNASRGDKPSRTRGGKRA